MTIKEKIIRALKNPKYVIKRIKGIPQIRKMNENLHKNGYNTLNRLDNILTTANIKYWLTAGSLLGAYRENGFIEHDLDIDIAIRKEDYKKAKEVLKNNGFAPIEAFFLSDGELQEVSYLYNDVKMDIFLSRLDKGKEHITSFYNEYVKDQYMAVTMILPEVNEVCRITLKDATVNIPGNAKEYLIAIFGERFMIKDKNWTYTKDIASAIYYKKNEKYGTCVRLKQEI